MKIGTVKERLNNEFRVGLSTSSVKEFVSNGHEVFIEKGAGANSAMRDIDYIKAGATILETASEVWAVADMIVKVKEPVPSEFEYFRKNQIIFAFLHLANKKELAEALVKSGTHAIAYETITTEDGTLPCLKPMSDIAGRLSAIIGTSFLRKTKGGSGILISGIPGVEQAKVSIVGAGNVGENALKLLVGLGANVTILDVNLAKLAELDNFYGNRIQTLFSSSQNLEKAISQSDLVIGAVSLPGDKTPQLIKRKYYKDMREGSVVIDVAIDQGGSTEVSRPTSHDNPVFVVDGILHYCVPNIPGAVPLTATEALNNSTISYGLLIANNGLKEAFNQYPEIKTGVNVYKGHLVNEVIAQALDLPYKAI